MKTKRIELCIGENFLSAFINGDESGLSSEDKILVDQTIAEYGPIFHVYMPNDTDPEFTRCDISGLYSNCHVCEVEVSK